MPQPADGPTGHLTLQFLAWVSGAPRTYREAMDVWRTSCPRLSVWEDALDNRLIAIQRGGAPAGGGAVVLTEEGAALLRRAAA